MKNNYTLWSLIFLVVFFRMNAQHDTKDIVDTQTELTYEQWVEDFDFLKDRIEQIHPNPFFRISKRKFDSIFEQERIGITYNSYNQNLVGLMRIIASIDDAHSNIRTRNVFPVDVVPFRTFLFDDGLYVIEARDSNLIGSKVDYIGDQKPEIIFNKLAKTIAADNLYHVKNLLPFRLMMSPFMEDFDLINEKNKVSFTLTKNGKTITREFKLIPIGEYYSQELTKEIDSKSKLPISRSNNDRSNYAYWKQLLEESNALYMQYNEVVNRTDLNMGTFSGQLAKDFESIDKLIIDLRECPGGNKMTYEPLIKVIKGSKIDNYGKLILLTGRRTNSAATTFILRLKSETNAITLGEEIGGSPVFYSDPALFRLPNSRIEVEISTRYNTESHFKDNRRSISPDFKMPRLASDYFAGKDVELDYALSIGAIDTKYQSNLFPGELLGRYELESGQLLVLENKANSGILKANGLFDLKMYKVATNHYVAVSNYDISLEYLPIERTLNIRSYGASYFARRLNPGELTPLELLQNGNIDEGLKKFRIIAEEFPNRHVVDESALNSIGYEFLRKSDYVNAIAVFKANTQFWPSSANVYDSLGEAYLEAGKLGLAKENFKKSLSINPNSKSSHRGIKKIEELLKNSNR